MPNRIPFFSQVRCISPVKRSLIFAANPPRSKNARNRSASRGDTLQNPGQVVGRLCQTPLISILGNNGTGLPTTCPSGNLPHFASLSENLSSLSLSSILQLS